jgi:hypothetical protein
VALTFHNVNSPCKNPGYLKGNIFRVVSEVLTVLQSAY